jgi:hypothetical protein
MPDGNWGVTPADLFIREEGVQAGGFELGLSKARLPRVGGSVLRVSCARPA